MSDWERRQRVYDYRAQRMMMGYPNRLNEAAGCAGCLLQLVFYCFLGLCLIAAIFFIYVHFFMHVPIR
jgi:hypothetical protein